MAWRGNDILTAPVDQSSTLEVQMRKLGQLAAAGVIAGAAALGVASSASASPAHHGKAMNANAHLVHVGLNPAICHTAPIGKASGEVNVHSNAVRGRTFVNISVHGALPDTTYEVDIRCELAIGSLTTNRAGSGRAHITTSAVPTSAPFFVDISVPGGGGGAGGYGDTFIAGPLDLTAK